MYAILAWFEAEMVAVIKLELVERPSAIQEICDRRARAKRQRRYAQAIS